MMMTVNASDRAANRLPLHAARLSRPNIRRVTSGMDLTSLRQAMTPTQVVALGWAGVLLVFIVSLVLCISPRPSNVIQELPMAGPTSLAQVGLTPDQLPWLVSSANDATGAVLETWLTGSDATGYSVVGATSYQRHGRHDGSHKKPLPAHKVHLNTATLAQLQTLPGVGPKMAMRILAYRKALGGQFGRIEQLLDVKGIGAKTFAKLAPYCLL